MILDPIILLITGAGLGALITILIYRGILRYRQVRIERESWKAAHIYYTRLKQQ